MKNQKKRLKTFRKEASELSRGVSSDAIYKMFVRIILENKLNGVLLDFGAGKGNLVNILGHMGELSEIHACDMFKKPEGVNIPVIWEVQDLNLETKYPDKFFDVVVSSETIEHLENPRAVAREWYRILKPGGLLLFSTPNNESLRSLLCLLIKGHYVSFLESSYPAHITPLLRKDITRILNEAGFKNIQLKYSDNGKVPGVPRITFQQIS
ncbi:MAG: methyltransferase domain-containing protein, partial [Candidatus Omnitrophica bacterium]|nr:methyltransferase domain-containing protein [Candidatus Omnitrophota bacterium]